MRTRAPLRTSGASRAAASTTTWIPRSMRSFVGKERRYNRRFLAMCNHYLIEPTAFTPASGWEKGQVENQVGSMRGWLFAPKLRFADLPSLNTRLARRCTEVARERQLTGDNWICRTEEVIAAGQTVTSVGFKNSSYRLATAQFQLFAGRLASRRSQLP